MSNRHFLFVVSMILIGGLTALVGGGIVGGSHSISGWNLAYVLGVVWMAYWTGILIGERHTKDSE